VCQVSGTEIVVITILYATFDEETVTAQLGLPEVLQMSGSVDADEHGALTRHPLYFSMSDGESFSQIVPLEGAVGFDSWTLHLVMRE